MSTTPEDKSNRALGCAAMGLVGLLCLALGIVIGSSLMSRPGADSPAPLIRALNGLIAARDAEIANLENSLRGVVAERNEAIELLKQKGLLPPAEAF